MMKAKQTVLCLGYALLGLLVTHLSSAADTPKGEEAINGLVTAFGKAMNAKDAAAFAATFHENADFTNVRGMSAHGRKAIENFHRPLFEGDGSQGFPSFKNATLKIVDTRIRFVRPDVANVDVTWTQTGSVLNGRDRGLRRGLMNLLVTKESGTWGILVMHNMDLPVEPPNAEPANEKESSKLMKPTSHTHIRHLGCIVR